MTWRDWLREWDMTSLKLKSPFLESDWAPNRHDEEAAWELYIELLTRTTTQPLSEESGDMAAALESVYSLFPITREIIRRRGVKCMEFSKIAIVVLNQAVRPFTTKWHSVAVSGALEDEAVRGELRKDLANLQRVLKRYTRMLGEMAGVEEDLASLDG